MEYIKLNICLSDLPNERIYTSKNGKKYIALNLMQRKEKSQYGETHTISVCKTKEDFESKAKTMYVGGGTLIEYKPQQDEFKV